MSNRPNKINPVIQFVTTVRLKRHFSKTIVRRERGLNYKGDIVGERNVNFLNSLDTNQKNKCGSMFDSENG